MVSRSLSKREEELIKKFYDMTMTAAGIDGFTIDTLPTLDDLKNAYLDDVQKNGLTVDKFEDIVNNAEEVYNNYQKQFPEKFQAQNPYTGSKGQDPHTAAGGQVREKPTIKRPNSSSKRPTARTREPLLPTEGSTAPIRKPSSPIRKPNAPIRKPKRAPSKVKGKTGGGMGWFGASLALFNFGSSYFDQRAEGESRLGSLAYASKELILPEFLGWKTHMALGLAPALAKGVVSGLEGLTQTGREYERAARDQRPFRNNTFVDSQQIYTMRQAGLALAEQSKYSLQQTLMGNEAEYMHR